MMRYVPWVVIATYALLALLVVDVHTSTARAPTAPSKLAAAVSGTAGPALPVQPATTATAMPQSTAATQQSQTPSPEPTAHLVLLPSLMEQTPLPRIVLRTGVLTLPSVVIASPPPTPGVPVRAPDAAPQIFEVQLPSDVVSPGQTIVGNVVTSSNVAAVEVQVARYSTSMLKVGEGRFTVTITVPHLPFFLRWRTYTVNVVAHNTRGDVVEQSLPITVR